MNEMPNEKSLEEKLEEQKMNEKLRNEVFDKVAIDLGFVGDKYYSAKEKMLGSIKTVKCSDGITGNPF